MSKFKKGDIVTVVENGFEFKVTEEVVSCGRSGYRLETLNKGIGIGLFSEESLTLVRSEEKQAPKLPPEVSHMTIGNETINAIVQAHLKDMYNIDQEIEFIKSPSLVDGSGTVDGKYMIVFKDK